MRGGRVVRRLDENVTRVAQREQPPGLEARDKIGHHMIVGAGNETQGNSFLIERVLQLLDGSPDLRTGVVVQARQNMWSAGDHRNAVSRPRPGHFESDAEIGGSVIDAR
jgi:hypothetical protein